MTPLARGRPGPRGYVCLHRKRQELALGRPAKQPRDSRIQESDNRLEDTVRGKGIAPVNSENPLIETEHDSAVGVGNDSTDAAEAEHGQAIPEQQVQLLPRFPASPLPHLHHSP
jgi:hypothetical protein